MGGESLKNIKFADDQAMVASSEDGLQKLMDSLNVTDRRNDMSINVKKMKTMKISRREEARNCITKLMVNQWSGLFVKLSFSYKMSGVIFFHGKFGHAMSDFKHGHWCHAFIGPIFTPILLKISVMVDKMKYR